MARNRVNHDMFPLFSFQMNDVAPSLASIEACGRLRKASPRRMREHPNMLATQTALNRLWHCESQEVDVDQPLSYCDRLRIRKAGRHLAAYLALRSCNIRTKGCIQASYTQLYMYTMYTVYSYIYIYIYCVV